ncbi:hypothetical protein NC652_019991 [Populus alba x Populus x berolinensis]|nr:hypothetical protein NC652_019991 [Populus alba x Populus x berolinensis]
MQGGGRDDERTRGPETAVTATGALAVWLEHGPRHLVGVREVGGFHQIVSQHATSFCNLGEAFHNRTANGHPSFVSQGAISCGAQINEDTDCSRTNNEPEHEINSLDSCWTKESSRHLFQKYMIVNTIWMLQIEPPNYG